MIDSLVFVTTNKDKLAEAKDILGIEIISTPVEFDEIQSLDPMEVVTKKAKEIYQQIKSPVLVEDTILVFNCLGKLPGPYIRDFWKTLGNDKLCELVHKYDDHSAYAQSTFAYCINNEEVYTFTGRVDGVIATCPMGEHGFGWDPIFIPVGEKQTFAQIKSATKNKYSMRAIALHKLRDFLFTN